MSRPRAAVLLVLVLALGACTDDSDPSPDPPASSSTVPTSPSTSAASAEPEETVRAWVEAQNEAMATGNSSAVRALSAKGCTSCRDLIDPIDEVFAAGGHFETDGWAVDNAKQTRVGTDSATVSAAVTIAGGRTYSAEGAKPVVYQAEHSIMQFRVVRADGAWLVTFVGFVS